MAEEDVNRSQVAVAFGGPDDPLAVESIYETIASAIRRGPPDSFTAFATVDPIAQPHVRMVVLRRMDTSPRNDARLFFTTHRMAEKTIEIKLNDSQPNAECCLWIPDRKLQLRLAMACRVVDGTDDDPADIPLRQSLWAEQSAATRAMFLWPGPGQPLDINTGAYRPGDLKIAPDPATAQVDSNPETPEEAPPSFAVVIGNLVAIDALLLASPVHRRIRHRRSTHGPLWISRYITA